MTAFQSYFVPQYRTTTLDKVGGLTAGETAGIKLASIPSDVDITQPGILCLTYSNPIDTTVAEWITYTSIDGTNVLQGVTRGAEGWSAKTHLNNCTIAWVFSKSHVNELMKVLTGVTTGAKLDSAKIVTALMDTNGNELLKVTATASAVNELTLANAATGNGPTLSATGGDTDIDINITPKGAGNVVLDGLRYPEADGTSGQVIQTDGSGNLTFGSAGIISTTKYAPRGFLINGKIDVTVSSNNLTVAIKGMDGNDPSASNPVYCRIGDTVRTITAALSVTKNAGTNWCDAGGAELATKEADYFVYLGYNATDGVVIGFSRISHGKRYDDFNTTSTDSRYCAISTITNAAAGDYYELIGRFAATLSAGAGYTWSVPTFTATNLIQRPIYESRWLDAATTFSGFSANPTGTFKYKVIPYSFQWQYRAAAAGTSNATSMSVTLPFPAQYAFYVPCFVKDNGSNLSTPGHLEYTANSKTMSVWKTFYQGTFTSSGSKDFYGPGTFQCEIA